MQKRDNDSIDWISYQKTIKVQKIVEQYNESTKRKRLISAEFYIQQKEINFSNVGKWRLSQ